MHATLSGLYRDGIYFNDIVSVIRQDNIKINGFIHKAVINKLSMIYE